MSSYLLLVSVERIIWIWMFFCFQSKVPVPVSFGCRRYHRVCTGLAEKAFTFLTQVIIINIKSYHKYGDSTSELLMKIVSFGQRCVASFARSLPIIGNLDEFLFIFIFIFQEVYAEWVCDFCYNGKGVPPVKFKS